MWYLTVIKVAFQEFIFGVHRFMLIMQGSLWTIVSETISNQTIERNNIDKHDPGELQAIITTKQKVIYYHKEKQKDLYQILTRIDDFADTLDFTRKSQLLHQLYIRGRRYMISTITSTQVYKQQSPIVRKNTTHLFIYTLINYGDLESIIEEMSMTYDTQTLLQMYHEAVSEPYSLLYTNLMMKDKQCVYAKQIIFKANYCHIGI